MKTRHVKIACDLYKFDVHFWHGDEKPYGNFVARERGQPFEFHNSAGRTSYYTKPRQTVHIWVNGCYGLKTPRGVSILTHEAVHAAMFVFEHIDLRLVEGNHEPLTYFVEWLVQEYLTRIPKAVAR